MWTMIERSEDEVSGFRLIKGVHLYAQRPDIYNPIAALDDGGSGYGSLQ